MCKRELRCVVLTDSLSSSILFVANTCCKRINGLLIIIQVMQKITQMHSWTFTICSYSECYILSIPISNYHILKTISNFKLFKVKTEVHRINIIIKSKWVTCTSNHTIKTTTMGVTSLWICDILSQSQAQVARHVYA